MFKLDFKKFKKISADKNSTTMQHEDGHKITIAHAPLTPKVREQLAALPLHELKQANPKLEESKKSPPKFDKGGKVDDTSPSIDPSKVGGDVTSAAPQGWSYIENIKAGLRPKPEATPQNKAGGGEISKVPSAEEDAIQPYGVADAVMDAGKWAAAKIGQSAQADTDLYNKDYNAWVQKNSMNTAMGTLGGPGEAAAMEAAPKRSLPFHEQAAIDKAAQNLPVKQGTTVGEAVQAGPIDSAQYLNKIAGKVKNPFSYADGGDVQQAPLDIVPVENEPNSSQMPASAPLDIVPAEQQDRAPAAAIGPPMPAPQGAIQPPDGSAPQTVQAAPEQQEEPPQLASQQPIEQGNEMPSLMGGYNKQMQGVGEEAVAKGALGHQQAEALQHAANQNAVQQIAFKDAYDGLEKERQGFIQDIKDGYVNPENYWKDHSKLMTGLGIILAGFNPTNHPNAAMEFLNHNMERNLQAQAQNLSAKHNLLAANLHQFGNLKDAMQMTRIMQHDMLSNQLDQLAAKSQDPLARARAKVIQGQIQMQAMPAFNDMAFRRAMMQSASTQGQQNTANPTAAVEQQLPYLRVLKPEMAKEIEQRLVPGVGIATIPVADKVRDELTSRQSLQEQVHNLREWSKKHSGELRALSPQDVNYGQALANSVQDAYRRANGQGVFREAEADFVKGIVAADPTAFFSKFRVDPKYKALEDSNLMQLNSIRKSVGLPQAQSTPTTKVMNGVQYQQVPGGWKKVQ